MDSRVCRFCGTGHGSSSQLLTHAVSKHPREYSAAVVWAKRGGMRIDEVFADDWRVEVVWFGW